MQSVNNMFTSMMNTFTSKTADLTPGENGALEHSYNYTTDAQDCIVKLWNASIHSANFKEGNTKNHSNISSLISDFIKHYEALGDGINLISPAQKAFLTDILVMIFQVRDCRKDGVGKGSRDPSRFLFLTLLNTELPIRSILRALIQHYPDYGYWKDLNALVLSAKDMFKHKHKELYAMVFNEVVDLYVKQITTDLDTVKSSDSGKKKLSLAAKYLPKENKACDKATGIYNAIIRKFYEIDSVSSSHKHQFRTEVVSRLNNEINTTETFMCRKDFASIKFELVPGRCLKLYTKAWQNKNKAGAVRSTEEDRIKCAENFSEFIGKIKSGQITNAKGQSLFIHEIIRDLRAIVQKITHTIHFASKQRGWGSSSVKSAKDLTLPDFDEDTEQQITLLTRQFYDHVDAIKTYAAEHSIDFSKVLVLADMSGSMDGDPMNVAIAFAILFSELQTGGFKDHFLSFETNPQWISLAGAKSLIHKVAICVFSPWGGSTNFVKAHKLIVDLASSTKLPPSEMPHTFMVVSDMQFDAANHTRGSGYKTIHEELVSMYDTAGYKLPYMIYWDVRGTSGDPVSHNTKGASMVSGFSTAMLKLFFKEGSFDNFTPWMNLRSALEHTFYEPIRATIEEVGFDDITASSLERRVNSNPEVLTAGEDGTLH